MPSIILTGIFRTDARYTLQDVATDYDLTGRLLSVTDVANRITNYEYGGNSNSAFLTKVTRVKDKTGLINLVTDLTYDSDGFVSSIKDEAGTLRYFTYDLYGRLRQVKNHAGTIVKAMGYLYSRTLANSWTYQAGSPNAVIDTTFVQQTPSVVRLVSTGYLDGLGRSIQSVQQDGSNYVVSATQYDLLGRSWRVWKPYTRTMLGYDPSFAPNATAFYNTYLGQSLAKPYVETQYTTDAHSRVKTVIPEFVGATATAFTQMTYGVDATPKHVFVETTDEMGKKTRNYSDVFGNGAKSVLGYNTADATTTQFTVSVLGQRTQTADPRGLITTYTHNTRSLQIDATSPDAGSITREFDRSGNLRYSQDANQAAAGTVMFTTYDFADRPVLVGVGPGALAALDPDAVAPPPVETSNANWLTLRAYDAKPLTAQFPWSLFSTQISPLVLQSVEGRLAAEASRSNGAWQVTLFSYDVEGRIATRYQYTQNAAGTAVWTPLNTVATSTYDLLGKLTFRGLTVGSATWNQWTDYTERGLLWKVSAATTAVKPVTADVTYSYRPSGLPATRQYAGGPSVPFTYTIREQLSLIGNPAATTYPFSAGYTYHANGTVSDQEFYQSGTPAAAKRYRYVVSAANYDALNRLKAADFSSWSGSAWTSTLAYDLTNVTYDGAGNLTALRRYRSAATLVDQLTYTYPGTSNRLSGLTDAIATTVETWDAESGSFTYDANGSLLTAPGPYAITATSYDAWNRQLTRTGASTTTAYRYAAGGQRLSKQVGAGVAEVYVTDGPTTLAVFTLPASGTPSAWHFNLLAGERVIGRQPNTGSRLYYHRDLLNSTRAVVSGTTVVESRDYDPWGVEMVGRTLGSGTKEGFTGQERDAESGLDAFWARQYLSAVGRWGTVDPPRDSFPEWSPYNYVEGNPVSYEDPFGLCPISTWRRFVCSSIEAASVFAASVGGFIAGGGAGALLAVATGGTAFPAVPLAAYAGAAAGSAAGLSAGRALTDRFFSEAAEGPAGGGRASGLRETLADHEKRLADYVRNPDANDNRGFLRNATSEEQRQSIIRGRIRNLENQIENFKRLIEQAERSP